MKAELSERFPEILDPNVVLDFPAHWTLFVSGVLMDIQLLSRRRAAKVKVLECRRRGDGLLYIHLRSPNADPGTARALQRLATSARWASLRLPN